ncbi:MAG: sec-independent protein translocase protein TatB [Kiritimatiellia bacterium]
MLGLGMGEILIVCAVVLVIVGPDKLPQFMRSAGRWYAQLRRTADEMRSALVMEADRQDADERYGVMQERRRQAEEQRRKAQEASPGATPQDEALVAPPSVDDQFDKLIGDPDGPYGSGGPFEPEIEPDHAPGSSTHATDLASHVVGEPVDVAVVASGSAAKSFVPPAGINPDEWQRLPEHIKRMLRSTQQGDA